MQTTAFNEPSHSFSITKSSVLGKRMFSDKILQYISDVNEQIADLERDRQIWFNNSKK